MILLVAGLILSRVYNPVAPYAPEVTIPASEAADYTGRRAEVCGRVASASYMPRIRGEPTFVNLGRAHPDQDFTILIWGVNRAKWSVPPERYYLDSEICVTGMIRMHEGTPQIEATSPEQIKIR